MSHRPTDRDIAELLESERLARELEELQREVLAKKRQQQELEREMLANKRQQQERERDMLAMKRHLQELERDMLANKRQQQERERDMLANKRQQQEQRGAAETSMSVSIYLADEEIHEQVETAVEQWLGTAHFSIDTRGEPVIGSWFRRMEAGVKKAVRTPAGREAVLTGRHIADSRLVQAQDAYVTETLLRNVGPVLQALQPTKDAVVRAGALLIVKVDWVVQVYQLTAAQQAILDHQPHLVTSPGEIIAVLQFPDPVVQEAALPECGSEVRARQGGPGRSSGPDV